MSKSPTSMFASDLIRPAIRDAFVKLDPRIQARNPVMFVTLVGAALTTVLLVVHHDPFVAWVSVWLWFTVLFANFAEAIAEGRGKAQAATLRKMRADVHARRLVDGREEQVAGGDLRKGDLIVCEAGDPIPADGDVVEGVASVDESAVTGESAPVIREAGGDRSAVTGGTRVLSDRIVIRVAADPGQGFLDRMIALVEGAERRKTPNELALHILLVALTLVFLLAVVTLVPIARYAGATVSVPVAVALLVCLIPTTIGGLLSAIGIAGMDRLIRKNVLAMSGRAVEAAGDVDVLLLDKTGTIPVIVLGALFVTLIPTTIGGLLSAIGIAGMDRLVKANVIAKSGRAVEAAGDVDTLLLDKTGTITFGNRMADALIPAPAVDLRRLAEAAALASLADETPEGKSIVDKAREVLGTVPAMPQGAEAVSFTAQTRLSGLDLPGGRRFRKGATDAVIRLTGQTPPGALAAQVDAIARSGGTPLLVAEGADILGAVHLKDIVKPGVRERFAELRAMGIRTVMITGDNPLTAAAIAAEAGVDDFLAEATPEMKLDLIRREQAGGRLVAMCGDGSNDAPALAQADVGVAMNAGTPAAKEAANLIDLDSDPTKLIEVVLVGKQLLISRGALTTFSIANDVAKYFAILPAIFVAAYPGLGALNIMGLASPTSAILSAVIFNALILVALVPLALRGVQYRPASAAALLRRNLLIYGLGGLIVPFVGIKLIDLCLVALTLA